jgi:hypothetical protein
MLDQKPNDVMDVVGRVAVVAVVLAVIPWWGLWRWRQAPR